MLLGPIQLAKRMFEQSVFAAWCEGQHGSTHSLTHLRVAVGEPVWMRTSDCLECIPSLLDEAQQKSRDGLIVLACVPYEAAPAFDPALKVYPVRGSSSTTDPSTTAMGFAPHQVLPWSEFVQQHGSQAFNSSLDPESRLACWTPWLNETTQSWFNQSFDQVREWIESGDFYQINLTTRLRASLYLQGPHLTSNLAENPLAPDGLGEAANSVLFELFLRLFKAQPAAFSMFLRLPDHVILSLSPELFFSWERAQDKGRIVTSPMKGTRKPGAQSPRLEDSSKDRAENLMIVDLLRNDLARVCLPRTVQAESLFDVIALPSVEQMTSTISGLTSQSIQVSELFGALFPCGSVTGAPKMQSMKRIAQLETSPRGVYCGALGVLKPDGSMRFSVPIRTLVATHTLDAPQRLKLEYGVGSGLTWYSSKQDEHKEWWQKTVFLRKETLDFQILETVRLEHRAWQNLELHLQRMRDSACRFSYVWNELQIREKLQQIAQCVPNEKLSPSAQRGRWLLGAEGNFVVQLFPLDGMPSAKVRLLLANRPIEEALHSKGMMYQDFAPFVENKTTHRPHYEAFAIHDSSVFDTLLYNSEGYLTETCRFNVVVQIQGRLVTPILSGCIGHDIGLNNSAKLLNGVLRQRLLSENRVQETPLHIGDLSRVEGVWLINSLRSWVKVDEIVNPSGDLIYQAA